MSQARRPALPRTSCWSSDGLLPATERFYVCDQLQEVAFAELPGEVRHHWRISGNRETARVQNAVSDIGLVSQPYRAILQMHEGAVEPRQRRRMHRAVLAMTAAAAVSAE